jgi:hypothetical protein
VTSPASADGEAVGQTLPEWGPPKGLKTWGDDSQRSGTAPVKTTGYATRAETMRADQDASLEATTARRSGRKPDARKGTRLASFLFMPVPG